jgi:prepilin-type N-terminal cleavage/methylation domain-containing protein
VKHKLTATASVRARPLVKRGQAPAGFTLLEVLLVLAVGGSVAAAGLQLYQAQKTELNLQVAKARINTMHRALHDFYAIHCFKVLSAKAQPETNTQSATENSTQNSIENSIENSTQTFDNPDVSSDILVKLGLLNSAEDSVNPFDGHFSPSINWDSTPVTVTVSTVGNSSPASVWRNYAPPKEEGKEFTWTRIASVTNHANHIEQQNYTDMYHEFLCQ